LTVTDSYRFLSITTCYQFGFDSLSHNNGMVYRENIYE